MGKYRINSKINQLPDEIKNAVDDMLSDTNNTYLDISNWLKEQGYDISRSAVGRYSLRTSKTVSKVNEMMQQSKAIAEIVNRNPDVDFAKGGRLMALNRMAERLNTASDEEFDELSLEKAARLIASLSRAETQAVKAERDYRKKVELAFTEFESQLLAKVKEYPDLANEMTALLVKIKDVVMDDN